MRRKKRAPNKSINDDADEEDEEEVFEIDISLIIIIWREGNKT